MSNKMTNNENTLKIQLYILSLWLLFFLVLILKINIPIYFGTDWEFVGFNKLLNDNYISLACIILLLLGILFYFMFDYKIEGTKKLAFQVDVVENANYEHLSFLATYIIPLICFNFDDIRYIFILVIVLIIIGAIYIKTNIFYANPTLALLGFHIYKARKQESNQSVDVILISKEKIITGDYLWNIKLDDKIYYVRRAVKK